MRARCERRERHPAIDYANLAELLYQLHVAAKNRGSGLALVVFQRELRSGLFATGAVAG